MTRTTAREIAIQLGFAAVSSKEDISALMERFFSPEHYETLRGENELYAELPDAKQMAYIRRLTELTMENRSEIDGFIERYAKGWKLERISKTALAVMRCAICEILYMDDIPNAAAINEAVELDKGYDEPDTVAFVNGVLGGFMRGEFGQTLPTQEEPVQGETIDEQRVRYLITLVREGNDDQVAQMAQDVVCITAKGKPIKAKTVGQQKYMKAIQHNTITIGVGPAGTGKTYLAVAAAVAAFRERTVNRIILTRPAVEAGERLGFLPGDLQNKVDPYLRPLYDALYDMLGAETFQKYQERGSIEVAPLAYMRGRTLDDSFIILDEAQNTTREQMKMFLTRLGFGSKIVITGDVTQIDLPDDKVSGLKDAVRVLDGIRDIAICRLTAADVVRHALVQEIIHAYEKAGSKSDVKKPNPEFRGRYQRKK